MDKPGHVEILEQWLKSFRPEEPFDTAGKLKAESAELASKGERRMSTNPHANGGVLMMDRRLPDVRISR